MFVDEAVIYVQGGAGGNGAVSFRREKYVPYGGPNGGDGGGGGSVIFKVDEGLNTLMDFRYQRHYRGKRGEHGKGSNQHGKNAEDLIVKVPPGTVVYNDDTGEYLADLTEEGEEFVAAQGGRGGRGNARFATPARKAPRYSEKGEPGEERNLRLELKLLADVGLIGYPNVGKSTLISRVSAARPKIASYHFTTLSPNLGVVKAGDYKTFVIADIPGLIEGAHEGVGLGDKFLRHVERTRLLLHLIDVSGIEGRDPLEDYRKINNELERYSPRLAEKKQIIVANKMDLPAARENLPGVKEYLEGEGHEVYPVSAVTGEGLDQLMYAAARALEEIPREEAREVEEPVLIKPDFAEEQELIVENISPGLYEITGEEAVRLINRTDFNNEAAVRRLLRQLRHKGLNEKLEEADAAEGDTVIVGPMEFEYFPE
ncbi:MAG: GTPase ObgE [Halanaerobium sp.]|nr:GTPase ObgE [Halanaerobium sp.]